MRFQEVCVLILMPLAAALPPVEKAECKNSLIQSSFTRSEATDHQEDKMEDGSCVIPKGMKKTRVSAGYDMVVFEHGDIVSESVQKSGSWEIDSAAKMASRVDANLPSSGVFLDIGANLGYYTFLFAHAGWKVLAVEPMTHNREAINATLCLNPQFKDRVTVVATALAAPGENEGVSCVVKSTNPDINWGNGFISCGADTKCYNFDRNCEAVSLKTLDSVLAEQAPPSIDAVKMDVETMECKVLQGGESLFTQYLPKLMQVETQWGNAAQCVATVAAKHGYTSHNLGLDTALVQPSIMM